MSITPAQAYYVTQVRAVNVPEAEAEKEYKNFLMEVEDRNLEEKHWAEAAVILESLASAGEAPAPRPNYTTPRL